MLSIATLRRTLVFMVAIALIGSFTHMGTSSGKQELQKVWQWVPYFHQDTLLVPDSTTAAKGLSFPGSSQRLDLTTLPLTHGKYQTLR